MIARCRQPLLTANGNESDNGVLLLTLLQHSFCPRSRAPMFRTEDALNGRVDSEHLITSKVACLSVSGPSHAFMAALCTGARLPARDRQVGTLGRYTAAYAIYRLGCFAYLNGEILRHPRE